MPSGAQNPLLIQVVPPSKTSTTAATPTANSAFEMRPACQNLNLSDMMSIARGNDVKTRHAHQKLFKPDAIV